MKRTANTAEHLNPIVRLSIHGRLRRCALLSGMGLSLIGAIEAPAAQAAAPAFGSPAWFAQARTTPNPAAPAGGANAPSAGVRGAVTTPTQALAQAQRSIQDLAHAAAAITAAQSAQKAAQQLALSQPSTVPDGLASGGLEVDARIGADPSLWQNARLPTQTVDAGKTNVTVKQTAQKAILTWDKFNVGRKTTLKFDQSNGTQSNGSNDWIALNRVNAGTAPSQILGQIQAEGSVYLINPSGIIFGGGSQVNVHTLIASSLPLFSDNVATSNAFFLNQGLAAATGAQPILGGKLNRATLENLPGDISIEAGASIETGELGFSLIAAPNVSNAGSIVANGGQAILAAGLQVSQPPPPTGSTNSAAAQLTIAVTGRILDGANDVLPVGSLSNTGLIQAPRGNITLVGGNIHQEGVLAASSSVTTPGSITIDARDERDVSPGGDNSSRSNSLSFGAQSVTALLPEENGETTTSTAAANVTFQTGTISITGGSVVFLNGALVEAPGQNVRVTALGLGAAVGAVAVPGRIYLDDGATIDVAGIADVQLALATNQVRIPRLGLNELADSPLQRGGVLFGSSVTVDASVTGVDANGNPYLGTPLANVSGYIQQVPRKIDQLLQNGGSVTLLGNEVLARAGSQLNLDGGYIHYLGGVLTTTKLIAANGAIIDIGSADPNTSYLGIAGQYVQDQPRFNLTRTYVNPLLTGNGQYISDYIQGGNAGTLTIYGASTTILDGEVSAHAFAGRNQVAGGAMPRGGQFNTGITFGGASGLFGDSRPIGPSYVLRADSPDLAALDPEFDADSILTTPTTALDDPDNILSWTTISTRMLKQGGFSGLNIVADDATPNFQGGEILVRSDVSVAAGGSINLTGSRVRIFGDLNAPAGSISVIATGDTTVVGSSVRPTVDDRPVRGTIFVGQGTVLNARGEWVNDAGLAQDRLTGGAFINGGSISLQTLQSSYTDADSGRAIDTTGSVILSSGSLLDVSSGGRILPNGRFSTSNDLLRGKGGNISLAVYVAPAAGPFGGFVPRPPLPAALPQGGRLQLEGTLLGYGFAGGGTLSLRALGIQLGDSAAPAPSWALVLPADFFTGQGFGSYVLSAEYDATITNGSLLTPTAGSWLPDYAALLSARSGTDIRAGNGYTSVGQLDDFHRPATAFTLYAGDFLNWRTAGGAPPDYTRFASIAGAPSITGTVLLGKGAGINADAGAKVLLGSINQVTVEGSIIARGGSITLTGDTAAGGLAVVPGAFGSDAYSSPSKSVWLGADSLLDVSGIALINPLAAPVSIDGQITTPRTGRLLAGGQILLTDNGGYVIALNCHDVDACGVDGSPGAILRANGASAMFDLPSEAGGFQRQRIYSDAGSITLSAGAGLYVHARLRAGAPADSTAAGGTLSITPQNRLTFATPSFTGAFELNVVAGLGQIPEGALTPGAIVNPMLAQRGILQFGAALLDHSGIETLNLGTDPARSLSPVPIAFSHDVSLNLGRAININTQQLIGVRPAAAADGGAGTSSVTFNAPYISLHGYQRAAGYPLLPLPGLPTKGLSLSVNAADIDLGGQFELLNFADADFNASGDIRLLTPAAYAYVTPVASAPVASTGLLLTSGNLRFTAAQLYPATDNRFIIDAVAVVDPATGHRQPTQVVFRRNAYSTHAAPPLSAGGSLLVDASRILQAGVLRAPAGEIVLGVSNPQDFEVRQTFSFASGIGGSFASSLPVPLTRTRQVKLTGHSVTSVSLYDQIVPYGQTLDGQNLKYNGAGLTNPDSTSLVDDLTAPPAKLITLSAVNIAASDGAVIDLSGGGDLQAQEFIPGTGGSRDVLLQYNISYATGTAVQSPTYGDARPIYAVIPGYSGLAPYDPAIVSGDPLIGQAVYLSGVTGLPAGVYTLLPGKYATLPGAYRVVQNTAAVDTVPAQNQRLPDGTQLVAGHFVDMLTGATGSRSTAFFVQSSAVWQQYSEYAFTYANSYFPALAARNASVVPLLPQDAGHLVFSALNSLELGATVDSAAVNGGVGAEVDIAANQLQITGSGSQALDGYVQVSAAQLDALNASSLVLGGTSSRSDDGQLIKAIATSVVADNGAEALTAPEITLVARSGADGGGITVNAGSVIKASGPLSANADVPILIGRLPIQPNGRDGVSGDGALLRVSNGAPVTVTRTNVTGADGPSGTSQGLLTIGVGASVTGDALVLLDATGNTVVDPSALFAAKEIDADSGLITFQGSGASGAPTAGLVISPQLLVQFASADVINLSSRSAIAFDGSVDVNVANALTLNANALSGSGGDVSIKAKTLTLGNTLAAAAAPAAAGSGALNLNADEIILAGGSQSVSGFGSFDASAGNGILLQGSGSLDFGAAAVSLHTPLVIADTGADSTLRSTGSIAFTGNAGGTPLTLTPLGGALSVLADSISVDTQLQALAGNLSLEATGGDVVLGSAAALNVQGVSKTFFDVIRNADGGTIKLTADRGSVTQASGAVLNFGGGDRGGDAGSLTISATQGAASLGGTLNGKAVDGFAGGSFSLDIAKAADLDTLAAQLAGAGVDQAIALHTRSGNLQLAAGNTLTAAQVTLIADGGSGAPSASDGNVNILGNIDASGAAGGSVALFGRSGVDLEGRIDASARDASRRGGSVDIGTAGIGDGSLNADYGYENLSAANSGTLKFGGAALIDVSGGSRDGSVHLRAPLLVGGEVNVVVADPAALVSGAREVALEAYARWSTADAGTGAQHFDGIIDPAGVFDTAGNPLAANADHSGFYGNTLLGFVQQPHFAFENRLSALSKFVARPGIDLVNPDSAVNGGNISVLSNWNLGAGSIGPDGLPVLAYRYQNGVAPVLTLRAAGNVEVDASISDGFFQYNTSASGAPDNSISPRSTANNPLPLLTASLLGATTAFDADGKAFTRAADSTSYRIVAGADSSSADPLALSASATLNQLGDVNLDQHTEGLYVINPFNGATGLVVAPTMIRTGVGGIDIAAANDVQMLDTVAPGVIYTAGRPADGTKAEDVSHVVNGTGTIPTVIDSGLVNPDSAGDITITAGHDINGIEQITDDGSRSGSAGTNLSQFWWPWMQQDCIFTGSCSATPNGNQSTINFANFDQGVMSVGGDVTVIAGDNIRDLGVSLPTSWYLSKSADGSSKVNTVGGGNTLTVRAGGDILSGDYFVAQGQGSIRAGGRIAADVNDASSSSVATLLAVQDARLSVSARGAIDIGGVFDPSYLYRQFDSQNYSEASSVRLSSTAGDINFNSLASPENEYGYGNRTTLFGAYPYLLPATLDFTALSGAISIARRGELYPSPSGQLSVVAKGDVRLSAVADPQIPGIRTFFGLIDAPARLLPSPLNRIPPSSVMPSFIDTGLLLDSSQLHTGTPLHATDAEPARIYSLDGDLIDGDDNNQSPLILVADKPAQIRAGRDIVNLSFRGQNVYKSDITLIAAGRDLFDTPLAQSRQLASIQLGGLGTLALAAGRNLGPITSANEAYSASLLVTNNGVTSYPGIYSVGNLYNQYLNRSGADISIRFGVAPGIDLTAFEQTYLDPTAVLPAGIPGYGAQLVQFVQRFQTDDLRRHGTADGAAAELSPDQAYTAFIQLPLEQQQVFTSSVLFDILDRTGLDYNDASSPYFGQYSRGYQAISTLFPARLGYSDNNLGNGANGAVTPIATGVFDMRGSTAQTQQGGNISVLGPGGQVVVGSTSAPPTVASTPLRAGVGPNNQGILTLEQGSIRIFTDRSVLLAQSRIFTEQGGDVLIWSSNGDINAGRGARTVSEIPPPQYLCDLDQYCVVDAKSQVSGAGIAVLQTKAGTASGNANLIAPAGTVDAGEAGIRVAGNLNVAALHIANAGNIQVSGNKAGVPTGLVNTGALSLASSVAAAVSQSATQVAGSRGQDSALSVLTVEVVGFGAPSAEQRDQLQ